MTLGNAGLRTYEAIDRITFGSSTAWTTVAEILTYTPKLNDKSARAGIRECVSRGYVKVIQARQSPTAAFRVRVLYNPGRNMLERGPVTAGPSKSLKREPRRTKPTDATGRLTPARCIRCTGTTMAGEPCRSYARSGTDLCRIHLEKVLGMKRPEGVPPTDETSGGLSAYPSGENGPMVPEETDLTRPDEISGGGPSLLLAEREEAGPLTEKPVPSYSRVTREGFQEQHPAPESAPEIPQLLKRKKTIGAVQRERGKAESAPRTETA